MTPSQSTLPVFPWTAEQVEEVADALERAGDADFLDLAKLALLTVQRTMRMESKPDPQGYPTGYGYRQVRGVTGSYVVKPDGSWEAL